MSPGFLVVLCAALVAGVPVLVVLLLLAVPVVGVAASLVLRRMLSCLRRCTLCGSPVFALPRCVPAAPSWSLRSHVRSVLHVWPLRFPALALARSPVSVLVLPRLVPASPPWSLRPLARRILLVLASRFPVLGLAELADPFLVVSVTSYLVVVPLYVGLELLCARHPGVSLFSVRSLE